MSRIINHEDHRILMLVPREGAAAHVHQFDFASMTERFSGQQLDEINRKGRLVDEKADGVWIDMVRASKEFDRLARQVSGIARSGGAK